MAIQDDRHAAAVELDQPLLRSGIATGDARRQLRRTIARRLGRCLVFDQKRPAPFKI
jgi:hypothetical protein